MNRSQEENATLVGYETAAEAESAVRGLLKIGFDRKRISVAAMEHRNDSSQDGNGSGRDCALEDWNSFWKKMKILLSENTLLAIPGVGRVLVAGALSAWMITALESAAIFSGMSAFVVIGHGAAVEVTMAKTILRSLQIPNTTTLSN